LISRVPGKAKNQAIECEFEEQKLANYSSKKRKLASSSRSTGKILSSSCSERKRHRSWMALPRLESGP
jgi:hypothetical protein